MVVLNHGQWWFRMLVTVLVATLEVFDFFGMVVDIETTRLLKPSGRGMVEILFLSRHIMWMADCGVIIHVLPSID